MLRSRVDAAATGIQSPKLAQEEGKTFIYKHYLKMPCFYPIYTRDLDFLHQSAAAPLTGETACS